MEKLRIGGVPEHFNLPWHLAIENGFFEQRNIKVEWQIFKGGTGAMTKALRNNEVDVCVVLTEGIIADIVNGNPSKIISKYINTPLIWGVFSGANNAMKYYGEIYEKQYAISRFGSGSHLMPQVDAFSKGKKIDTQQFKIIKNLEGALESLQRNETDAFYWEKFTTKPYVDQGILKLLGEYVTPWPCFMIAATDKCITEKPQVLKDVLETVYFTNDQFMTATNTIDIVSERYQLKPEDTTQWFYNTEWSNHHYLSKKMVKNVLHTLKRASIIDNSEKSFEDIYCNLVD